MQIFLSPVNPFFIDDLVFLDNTHAQTKIVTYIDLIKDFFDLDHRNPGEGWATYPKTITAIDNTDRTDSKNIDIIIIEVNNAPEFDIGVQTLEVYTKGENNSFYYNLGKVLEDSGEETPTQDLIFNLYFLQGLDGMEPFFDISELGIIDLIGSEDFIHDDEEASTYLIKVCANDTGLTTTPHPLLIEKCFEEGDPAQDGDPKSYCNEFSLTITKKNREVK